MGWAKYGEDNTEIMIERKADYEAKKRYVKSEWLEKDLRSVHSFVKNAGILRSNIDIRRINELYWMRDRLSCKINLALSIANNMETDTMQCIAESMGQSNEISYKKITDVIESFGDTTKLKREKLVDRNHLKRILVMNMFYEIEEIFNDSEEIDKEELEELKSDMNKLIIWYYDETSKYGKIIADNEKKYNIMDFLKDELGETECYCSKCGGSTILEWKFCLQCAGEN